MPASEPSLSQVAAHSGKRLYNAGGELSWQTPPEGLQNGPTAPQGALSQHAATQDTAEPMPGFENAGDRRALHRVDRAGRAKRWFNDKITRGDAIVDDHDDALYVRGAPNRAEDVRNRQAQQALDQPPYGPQTSVNPAMPAEVRRKNAGVSREDWRRDVLDELKFGREDR